MPGVLMRGPDGAAVVIELVDTGSSDGRGNQLYRLGVDTTVSVGPVTIGAVTLQDNDSLLNADVAAVTGVTEAMDALVVQAPVLGKTTDAADQAGGATTVNGKLRGLIQIFADVWNSVVHALGVEGKGTAGAAAGGVLTVQGDAAGTPIPVDAGATNTAILLDAGGVNEAKIAAATAIAEANNALAVQAPVLGVTTGAKVITDANGTIQQYLRGIVYQLLNGLPATLGQKAMAASTSVVVASDQTAVPVSGNVGRASTTVSQASQASTNAFVDVTDCAIDALAYSTLSYTIINLDVANGLSWQVLAANQADYSDAVTVKTSTNVAAGGTDSYTANPALYRYYKPQIKDQVGGSHAAAKVAGIAKG